MIIRPASEADAEAIRRVERSAGARFTEIGMEWVAAHEPMSAEELNAFAEAGRSWVAVDDDGVPVGYAVAEAVDGCGHIEQVSVDLDHQGRGIGRALVEEVEAWAIRNHLVALTLTTFTDVGWNRPLYEHLGFTVVPALELTGGLRAIRDHESERGLDPSVRVCMRKMIGQTT